MVAFKEKRTPPLKPTKPSPVSESSHSSENYACLFSLTLGWGLYLCANLLDALPS